MFPVLGSISTRRFLRTSVTKAVRVRAENVAQHVAVWPAMVVFVRLENSNEGERESVVAPKAASVANSTGGLLREERLDGMMTLPNRTAVPLGEERMSGVTGQASWIGRTETKPGFLVVGSPFTVVMSAEASALKRVWETVFKGPTAGVDCPISKVVRSLSESGVRPVLAEVR